MYICMYMEVNNENKTKNLKKIEKQNNPKVMNLFVNVWTFRF